MNAILKRYHAFLKLEKSLSENTIEAYQSDLNRFLDYLSDMGLKYDSVSIDDFRHFLEELTNLGISVRSQARIISGIKSFYRFLQYEEILDEDPTELLEMPKLAMHLPEVLSVEEIDNIIEAIDMSKKEGIRNRVIIEMLYGSGLRVSELIDVKISNIHFDEGYVCVIGKGNKQRLVPISSICKEYIKEYLHERASWRLLDGFEDYLFINRSGKNISRVAIFNIVKQLVELAGIKKTISPHTFRHSFATHLLEGGANLRDIQQMLGHSSILTTEIYTHIDVEYLRDTIMKFHPKNKQ